MVSQGSQSGMAPHGSVSAAIEPWAKRDQFGYVHIALYALST